MATTKPSLLDVWAKDAVAADLENPGTAKYNAGWLYGEKPPHKFINWLQNVFSKAFAHLNERGVLEHDLTTPYLAGAVVWKGNKVFKARLANTGQDTALTSYWQEQSLPDMPTSGNGFILYYTGAKLYWKDHQDLNYGTYEGRVATDKKPYVVVNDNTLGNPPLASEINPGELALNFKEQALYTKTPEGAIIVLAGAASIKDWEFIATAGQTTFTVSGGYTVGQIEVFINGRKQLSSEYVANNGTTVVFNVGLVVGDAVVISVWGAFSVANTYTQAQVDALLLTAAAPAGAVTAFAGSSAPAGYLICDGATVSRVTYAALFAVLGTVYGAGDESTTFKIPDLRGEFIRGFDGGRLIDSGRVFGSAQADSFKSHTHNALIGGSGFVTPYPANSIVGSTVGGTGQAFITASGSTETRPRNIAMLYCIKF